MCREIDEFPAFFTPSGERPLIIDAGANIGVSMLEWKSRWPQCEIMCFEPDPHAFKLLQQNIDKNGLPGVTCHRVALSDHDGPARLHGAIGNGLDARGNSLSQGWGQRDGTDFVEVECRRLSAFIGERQVSFLKLDVEGSEERVLNDIQAQLSQIEAIYVEVHETNLTTGENSSARIIALLTRAGFALEQEVRHAPHALPASLASWGRRVEARQTQLLCWRE